MATRAPAKKAPGILAPPPRAATRHVVTTRKKVTSPPDPALKVPKIPASEKHKGLTPAEDARIYQSSLNDIALGNTAKPTLDSLYSNFSSPTNFNNLPQLPGAAPTWAAPPTAPDWSSLPGMGQVTDWGQAPQRGSAYDPNQGPQLNYTNMGGLPQGPVTGNFNDWRQGQIDSTYNDFTRRMEPQFKQEQEDFEQHMANIGVPMGSQLYDQEKQKMVQGQNDARSSALVSAQGIAGQNASQFANVGFQNVDQAMAKGQMGFGQTFQGAQQFASNQAQQFGQMQQIRAQYGDEAAQQFAQQMQLHGQSSSDLGQQFAQAGTAYGLGQSDAQARYASQMGFYGDQYAAQQQQKYQPIKDLTALNSLVSPQAGQNLQYFNTGQLNNAGYQSQQQIAAANNAASTSIAAGNNATAIQVAQINAAAKAAAGGDQGLGGFQGSGMSFQEYLAAKTAADQASAQYGYDHNPAYNQGNSGPSYSAQIGGQILNTGFQFGGAALYHGIFG